MKKRVLQSIETPEGDRCVDIFVLDTGLFGFEIYRRDTKALTGWFATGGYADRTFETEDATLKAARRYAPWLSK